MTGVPIRIVRAGKTEKVYLSTRRSGEAGEKMKTLKRRYHKASYEASKAAMRSSVIMQQVDKLDASAAAYLETLAAIEAKQTDACDEMRRLEEKAFDLAEELVRCSLKENHGDDVAAIMDCLTDKQIHQCISAIELGEEPEDFFHGPDTQPKLNFTLPDDAVPPGHSLPTGSPDTTSKPGR